MKAGARHSQGPKVSLLPHPASLYGIPDVCPALSLALGGGPAWSKASLGPACLDTRGGQVFF